MLDPENILEKLKHNINPLQKDIIYVLVEEINKELERIENNSFQNIPIALRRYGG